ncbi:hypothetical protein [Aeromicrobium sp. Leaf350]|uniref:hypothetical protein n=1 Tax=Aeromicrobium sp. Leaf350 TaxID=2876565 RepID=UPI001E40BE2A|nr:hypothetical protein [Aeromicrobium sp. Leaf350]
MSDLTPLHPILGGWRTSGTVLDEHGAVSAEIAGTDTYTLLPGGTWIAHEVDVDMGGGQKAVAHELIGGENPDGGWNMFAFDESPTPGTMRLTLEEPGLLLLHGEGVRSWFRIDEDADHLSTCWERRTGDTWTRWMDLRFDRF